MRFLSSKAWQLPTLACFFFFCSCGSALDEYHAASIFCAPSNWDDPCPLIIPEAMACGLPVVATATVGRRTRSFAKRVSAPSAMLRSDAREIAARGRW